MEIEKLATIVLIALSFAIGLYAYPMLPANVASHWGISGEVNGYLPSFWGAFLIPALSVVLFLVFLAIPLIDPLSENIRAFMKDYLRFIFAIILFLFLVYVQTLLWNLGTQISFSLTLPVLLGLLLFYTGYLLGKVKRNWFIGIRTPWTISSDEVWDKTHKLGKALFMAIGIVSILSFLLPMGGILLVIALIIAAAIAIVVYSYFVYRNIARKQVKNQKKK
jgi:uncharacterized membrane protein